MVPSGNEIEPLSQRDIVVGETPEAAATSLIVARLLIAPSPGMNGYPRLRTIKQFSKLVHAQ